MRDDEDDVTGCQGDPDAFMREARDIKMLATLDCYLKRPFFQI